MNKIADEPRQLYKISSAEEVDLNNKTATDYLDTIYECEKRIKELNDKKTIAQFYIQHQMKEKEIGVNPKYKVKWGSINYKATPERVIPAKEARTVRRRSISITKI